MSAFPTFRLPFLAAKDVVNQMDISDLTSLFLCSRKTRAFIKLLRKPVSFFFLSQEQKKDLSFLEIIELLREEKLTGNSLKENGMKIYINISNDSIFELWVKLNIREDDDEYLSFSVYAKRVDQQDQYKGTKRNLKIGDLKIPVVMTKKDVIYTFWDSKQEGLEKFKEYLYANCFTIGNFLTTDCKIFFFQISKFTNADFNECLKEWMAGKFPKLERLYVEMQEEMNIDIILSGLEDLPKNTITHENTTVTVKRNDGYLAMISTPRRKSKTFEMNIYPNYFYF